MTKGGFFGSPLLCFAKNLTEAQEAKSESIMSMGVNVCVSAGA